MKTLLKSYLILAIALTGCRSPAQVEAKAEAKLHRQIEGKWSSEDKWLGQPFSHVTFYEDGSFTRTNADIANMAMGRGYWRLHKSAIILTVQKGGLPPDPLVVFQVVNVTDRSMTFTNLVDMTCIHFQR